ncbi:MAG: beta-galactosidase trimerization domain-containing protein [Clostridia bacterium]|nr:beta-galactosidase trimerization domain-containing protein [Clostridia bacterium]
MRKLPTRQVHLDFHTSPHIPGIGSKFDKAQFQAALKEGNLNSITVFAKCHHGVCYYPTRVGTVHPGLEEGFDLTGAMVDACHEIGVAAPIYITVGWSVQDAAEHPEWRSCQQDGTPQLTNVDPNASPDDLRPECSWENMCPCGDYAEHIYRTTEEICDRYPHIDGLFYDIVYLRDACWCPNCIKGMKEAGLDPDNIEDARAYYRKLHLDFAEYCRRILHAKHPEATIFFNSGGAEIYRPEYHVSQTHFEMEDLPTVWGGYDKMVPRASVMSRYGKDYLGMTGKFHTSWGEFGGYKNPDALTYEVLMMGMFGACCSVGDHMPPSGQMDMATYKLIGQAYRAFEPIEPWFFNAKPTAKLGVYLAGKDHTASDEGLHRMLLEAHLDFEIVLPGDDLRAFETLILPEYVALSDEEAGRINAFIAKGGSVLFTGHSALKNGKFQLDAGVEYVGDAQFQRDYLSPTRKHIQPFTEEARFLCYNGAVQTTLTGDAEILSHVYLPWFERTYEHYCGHKYAPYQEEPAKHPGSVKKGNVIYIAHNLCSMYYEFGAQVFRDVFINTLKLIHKPVYQVKNLPSAGRTRLTCQAQESRYVFHASYASPIQRGMTSVIEDIPTIDGVEVEIAVPEKIREVRLITSERENIPFTQESSVVKFTLPKFRIYEGIEILY